MNNAVRTAEVLALLAAHGRPVPASMIARECAIPRSSTYGILNALADAGFAEAAGGGFKPGPRAAELAGGDTIDAALRVLESYDQSASCLTPSELCRRSGLPLAHVESLIEDLAIAGLLSTSHHGVSLGVRLAALAARSRPLHRLRTAARPVLSRLRDATGETANLIVRDGREAVYLDQVESMHALRHAGWAGLRIPLERGAAAMALTDDEGVRVARDVVELGVTAVACRISAPAPAEPRAAVGITGPTARMTKRQLLICQRAVERAAFDVAAAVRPPRGERLD